MIKIRKNVFETNSSSTHSISISRVKPDREGCQSLVGFDKTVRICDGDFGWEQERYNDAYTKASYCLTWIWTCAHEDVQDKLLGMLRQVILMATGAKKVVFNDDGGSIDHQSSEVAEEAFASEETLRNFIFNPNSWLETDNDNH